MELLRITAMLLVMTDHAGFMALGVPTTQQTNFAPVLSLLTFSDMSVSIVCVNVFVILSGWFGIRLHWEKLYGMIFQVMFFSIGVFIVMFAINHSDFFNLKNLSTLFMLNNNDYWFIKSYILLFLLTPFLNHYIDNCPQKTLRTFLIAFYSFQTIYAWASIYGAGDFVGGYSALSFVGLYTLTRYLRLYCEKGKFRHLKSQHFFGIFFGIAILQCLVAFAVTNMGFSIAGRLFTYTNPLVIIQAAALVWGFGRIKPFYNKTINWIASSCLAVYLLHANELLLRTYYAKTITNFYNKNTIVVAIIYTATFILLVFSVSILIDKIRKRLWDATTRTFSRQKPI